MKKIIFFSLILSSVVIYAKFINTEKKDTETTITIEVPKPVCRMRDQIKKTYQRASAQAVRAVPECKRFVKKNAHKARQMFANAWEKIRSVKVIVKDETETKQQQAV